MNENIMRQQHFIQERQKPVLWTAAPITEGKSAANDEHGTGFSASTATELPHDTHYIRALLNEASRFEARALYERAIAYYNDILAIDPHHGLALNNRGICYEELGQLEEALNSYQLALHGQHSYVAMASGNYCRLVMTLVEIWNGEGKHTGALVLCDNVLQRTPHSAIAYKAKGNCLELLGKREEAITSYIKAVSIDPSLIEVFEALKRLQADKMLQ